MCVIYTFEICFDFYSDFGSTWVFMFDPHLLQRYLSIFYSGLKTICQRLVEPFVRLARVVVRNKIITWDGTLKSGVTCQQSHQEIAGCFQQYLMNSTVHDLSLRS